MVKIISKLLKHRISFIPYIPCFFGCSHSPKQATLHFELCLCDIWSRGIGVLSLLHSGKPLHKSSLLRLTNWKQKIAKFLVQVDIGKLRYVFMPLEWIGMNAMLVYVMAAEGIFAGFINGWYYDDPHNTLVYIAPSSLSVKQEFLLRVFVIDQLYVFTKYGKRCIVVLARAGLVKVEFTKIGV